MTKEEASKLKSGDIILGTWSEKNERTITRSKVEGDSLCWSESIGGSLIHSWNLANVWLVKAKEEIINDYQIY